MTQFIICWIAAIVCVLFFFLPILISGKRRRQQQDKMWRDFASGKWDSPRKRLE